MALRLAVPRRYQSAASKISCREQTFFGEGTVTRRELNDLPPVESAYYAAALRSNLCQPRSPRRNSHVPFTCAQTINGR